MTTHEPVGLVIWAILFFGGLGIIVATLVKRARVRRRRARAASEYAASVSAPLLPEHVWGPADGNRPQFDAPGGLAAVWVPRVVPALRKGTDSRDDEIFGSESTRVGPTLVTAFDHVSWYRDTNRRRSFTHDACAHFRLGERVPYVYLLAKSVSELWGREPGLVHCQFESDDFNRAFAVVTRNRTFATALVSAQVIELCLCEPNLRYFVAAGTDLVVGLTPSREIAASSDSSGPVANPEPALRFVARLLDRLPDELRPHKTSPAGPAS